MTPRELELLSKEMHARPAWRRWLQARLSKKAFETVRVEERGNKRQTLNVTQEDFNTALARLVLLGKEI